MALNKLGKITIEEPKQKKSKKANGLFVKKAKQPVHDLSPDDPFAVDDPFEPAPISGIQQVSDQILQAPRFESEVQAQVVVAPSPSSIPTTSNTTGNRWGNPPLPPSLSRRA